MFRIGRGRALAVLVGTALALVVLVAPVAAGSASYDLRTSFGNGTWRVGAEIAPGTYRTRSSVSDCYWARLKGFSGQLGDIIANDFSSGFQVVTIKSTDKGFESNRCGTWSSNLSQVTSSKTHFGQGTLIVGTDIEPGLYRSSLGNGCYWARLSGFQGTLGQIIANDFRTSGTALVRIKASDRGFQSSHCGTWTKQ